ncbi:MAG: ornithine cyclodeaminase family protein [Alphaproteobacteria bacterium]|nr:ornithine cyclodeaminase family protein [Alphaproteobacteria bacterium]
MTLPHIEAAQIDRALQGTLLIDRLEAAFRDGAEVPLRHHHHVDLPGAAGGTLLLMPAWRAGGPLGVKVVSVYPDNPSRGLPSVIGLYLLFDGTTGQPRAVLDGVPLTLHRTAAASALAARFLARTDAATMLMVGAGALAPYLIRAHSLVRPIREVMIWNRNPGRARALAERLAGEGIACRAVGELEAAARRADIVSCATMSSRPLVQGAWLRPGTHLDLVGAYTPKMRETDDEVVRRASLFVDTRQGGTSEAGDIVDPLARGVIAARDILADLYDLCRGRHPGRTAPEEITLFKSVGTALEDLAAADLVMERL